MKWLLQVSRFFVGGLFIFSGAIKINDPVGTAIKLEEYFEVFATDIASFFEIFVPLALPLAVFLCVLEVVLGIAVLLNYRVKITYWLLLIIIVFFTFLTFYSAYFDKVTDCGCFGDAIKLTPWESFIKDIILTIFIAFLFLKRGLVASESEESRTKDIIIGGATALSLFIGIYAIRHLPFIDFRAYKVGNNLPELMEPSGELKYEYVMEKDGKEYRMEQYPTDKSYTFKEMVILNPEVQPKITDYAVWNDEGDFTQETFTGNKLFVITYNVEKVNKEHFSEINTLISQLSGQVDTWALTASDPTSFEAFRHEVQLAVPYYYSDATVLKTIIRSNPGLLLVKDGLVKGKWHFNDVPTAYDVQSLLR
ncbi:DoxX family protein [Imperialibacter roseus]|uniref:DoxX family protein n=1 Tax=Imperialibacter roseus TaxID=1324217 RepID=A0ABZ0IPI1_9BACT|nr:BT_3928 family protein [Imperialibacter roseus]WOK06947.1 DoxX family protein [Imperialibacter roseus]